MSDFRGLIVLDRDGVLNRTVFHSDAEPRDSPLSPADVVLEDGVPEALKALEDAGYELAVASNQPSAAKGKTTHESLVATHEAVLEKARAKGARIAGSFVCFHRAEDGCPLRAIPF
jgi:D-glycero-D-manno-heptose 1,7-bisphosphate phosphatase